MPLQINAATSGSTTLTPTDAVTATLTLPGTTGTLLGSGGNANITGGTKYQVNGTTVSALAWVNFNGTTSPGTIRSSYNISSITKNGTGQYVANITNALSDSNYAVIASCSVVGSYPLFCNINSTSAWSIQAPTTTAFAINSPNYNASGFGDPVYYSAVVFGN